MRKGIPRVEIKEISPPYRRNEAFCKVTSQEELGMEPPELGTHTGPSMGFAYQAWAKC